VPSSDRISISFLLWNIKWLRTVFISEIFFQEILKPMMLWKADLYFLNPLSKVSLAKSYIRFASDWHVAWKNAFGFRYLK